MSPVDNNGIPIVQTSDRISSKRKVSEGEDEIKLYRPQNKNRNFEYFRTSSPSTLLLNSPKRDSFTHASTEPLYSTHSFSPLRSPSFTSDIYLKPRNASLVKKPKRKPLEFDLLSTSNKLASLQPTRTMPKFEHMATPPPTQQKEKQSIIPVTPPPTIQQKENDIISIQKKENLVTPLATPQKECETKEHKIEQVKDEKDVKTNVEDNKTKIKDEIEEAEAAEIADLMKTVKCLPNYYKLISKIGEGTFSTVYKALDIRRDYYYNQDWETPLLKADSEEQKSKTLSQFVALKRVYDTSSPRRIANEIYILCKLRGSPCISPLITAFRQQDQVFIVMPHIPNDDFKTTFMEMTAIEIKAYLKSLLTALSELHKHRIIHRDVKPNNFLYNRRKKIGYLIDFGLAEHEDEGVKLEEYDIKVEARSQGDMFVQSSRAAAISRKPLKQPIGNSSVLATLSNKENRATNLPATPSTSSSTPTTTTGDTDGPRVMGYVKNDARHHLKANRAGTRGFRAPEILLKVTRQTCAVDIWAAGVILSCFMTGRYPFFLANEESDAIIELGQVYGYRELKKCANLHNRLFSTNINIPTSKVPWSKLIEHLNKETIKKWDPQDYKDGLDLLERCLDLNHHTRITAKEALEHPFLL